MNLAAPQQILNYIGGTFCEPTSGKFLDNSNPATGKVYNQIPDSQQQDVQNAVEAAKKAFPEWSTSSAEYRFRVMNKMADLIEENLDALALAETNDNGKPLSLSKRVDIPRAAENFRFLQQVLCTLLLKVITCRIKPLIIL